MHALLANIIGIYIYIYICLLRNINKTLEGGRYELVFVNINWILM